MSDPAGGLGAGDPAAPDPTLASAANPDLPPPARPPQVAVFAASDGPPEMLAAAEAVGRALAARGCVLVCGGLGGGMRAACRGAKAAGGSTVGIIPGYDAIAANAWVDRVVCTGLGQARNALVAASGEAAIAVGGGFGTLSEIALALRLGRPVVLLGGWADALSTAEARAMLAGQPGRLLAAATAEEAVRSAVAAIVRA